MESGYYIVFISEDGTPGHILSNPTVESPCGKPYENKEEAEEVVVIANRAIEDVSIRYNNLLLMDAKYVVAMINFDI